MIGALYYFQQSPWHVDANHKDPDPLHISREAKADVVLVLNYDAIEKSPKHFEKKDWSAAWINLLEQEVGPITIATPKSLSHRVLAESRVVILTASVTSNLPGTLLEQLRQHIDRGNTLVIERPTGGLREAFSADGSANTRRGREVTFALDLPEPHISHLKQMPLSTDYIGSVQALEGATTLMSIDGAPVVYAKPIGQGHVITIDFDLGEQLVALQQGKPSNQFTVKSKQPKRTTPMTQDLILNQDMLGSSIPYADLLERFIVHGVISRYCALPVFWLYPYKARGMVIGLHEDDTLGDGGGWMLQYENSHKASSTILTSTNAGLTAAGATTMHRQGGDMGLLWRMQHTPYAYEERLGMGGFQPLARPVTLEKQLKQLKQTLPINYVRTAKVAGDYWSTQWDEPFKRLSAVKIRTDMSYSTPNTSGYAFGTGIPFLALSSDGLPLGIRELPVVIPDRPTKGPKLTELLEMSQRGHHMTITLSMSPATFADYPDLAAFEQWLHTFEVIKNTEHRMTSASRFDAFLRRRRASSIRSRLVRNVAIPRSRRSPSEQAKLKAAQKDKSDPLPPLPTPEKNAILLRITVEAKNKGQSLAVPERIDNHRFATARQRVDRVGKELVSSKLETDVVDLSGHAIRRIPLERGFNTIDLYYKP